MFSRATRVPNTIRRWGQVKCRNIAMSFTRFHRPTEREMNSRAPESWVDKVLVVNITKYRVSFCEMFDNSTSTI